MYLVLRGGCLVIAAQHAFSVLRPEVVDSEAAVGDFVQRKFTNPNVCVVILLIAFDWDCVLFVQVAIRPWQSTRSVGASLLV